MQSFIDNMINPNVWNKLYKRVLWENIRFPVGHVYEDIETMYQIFDLCKLTVVIDESLYFHRKRQGSITDTSSAINISDGIRATELLVSYIENNTPELFTDEQLMHSRQSLLNTMISFFVFYSIKGDDLKTFRD